MRLQDKVAIITGASSGIGKGITLEFLKQGAKVLGCGLEEDTDFKHENFAYIKVNFMNPGDIEKIVPKALDTFGKLTTVVNCAGITLEGSIEESSLEDFKKQFTINVDSIFLLCKSAVKELKKHAGASIINIGSDLGVRPIPGRVGYSPSKAAVIMLSKCMAVELAPTVRVNVINPGLVLTPMISHRVEKEGEALLKAYADIYPLKRMGTLQDMAQAAVYLASDDSTFITGETLNVCGGSLI
ncbi:MAG: SDR family NAD(P)-dependent oxidoreductase [Brevinema sp.]